MPLLTIAEPEKNVSTLADHPFLRLGFRPFYLLAAVFAAFSVPLWIAQYYGWLSGFPHVGLYWHMHEMVYGFAIAVIIGFLYTAGRNWTGLWTPRRGQLAAIAALWLVGRIAILTAPPIFAAIVDVAFLPLAAWPIYSVLQRTGNKRNLFLVGLLGVLALANAAFHMAVLGWIAVTPVAAIQVAILVIVMIESAIGARVIPGFTVNGAPGTKTIVHPKRDRICLGLTVAASLSWICGLPAPLIAALAGAAACSQLLRLSGWKPHRTLHQPLLWILHLSYAWIPIGFFLIALSALNIVSPSAAFHALTVGSMAGLIIGMMTRTTLGHTGRPLKVGKVEVLMYLLIQSGAIARLWAAIDTTPMRDTMLVLATVCWSGAFLLYAIVYGPYLYRSRIDGREG